MNSLHWQHETRIAWKDMRRLSPFAIVLLGFWIVWLAGIVWFARNTSKFIPPFDLQSTLWGMYCTVLLYVTAWASITFSLEHEEGSYAFLRSLPVSARSVFLGKLLYGLASTLMLAVALTLIGALYAWLIPDQAASSLTSHSNSPPPISWAAIFLGWGLGVGMLCSQRIRYPLAAFLATCATPFVCMLAVHTITWIVCSLTGRTQEPPSQLYQDASLRFATVAFSAVAFALAWKGCEKWLHGTLPDSVSSRYPFARSASSSNERIASDATGSRFGRLLWLSRRSNRLQTAFLAINLIVLIATVVLLSTRWFGGWTPPTIMQRPFKLLVVFFLLAAGFSPIALGIGAFRAEHKERRFQLLAQVGVHPFLYWASRCVIPAFALLALVGTTWCDYYFDPSKSADKALFALWMSFLALAAFSISQFCSIAFRSLVYACCATCVGCTVLGAWTYLCAPLQLPPWLVFGPIIALPLLASFLRVPRWFRATGSYREWVVPSIPIALLLIGLPIAAATYRVMEVPSVTLPNELLVDRELTDDDRAGIAAYERVFAKLPDVDSEIGQDLLKSGRKNKKQTASADAWMNSHRQVVDELVEATKRGTMLHSEHQTSPPFRLEQTTGLTYKAMSAGGVLLNGARLAEQRGDFEEAWSYYAATLRLAMHVGDRFSGFEGMFIQHYIESQVHESLIHWAMQQENGYERIEQAAIYLEERRRSFPPRTQYLRTEYLNSLAAFSDSEGFQAYYSFDDSDQIFVNQIVNALSNLPFEERRARRLNDYCFKALYDETKAAQLHPSNKSASAAFEIWQRFAETTLHQDYPWYAPVEYVEAEQFRRAMIYQMVAIAIHKKTDAYPTSFDGVTVGEYELPDDMYVPGEKLLIGEDRPGPGYQKVPGLFICSSKAFPPPPRKSPYTTTTSRGFERLFLLPDFEKYTPENWQLRADAASFNGRTEISDD